jgi:predicted DNA-binding protein (MmcQ/YjbR family)
MAAEEHRKISRTEGCFITKLPGFHLEKSHWVNAVLKNTPLKFEVVRFMKIHF